MCMWKQLYITSVFMCLTVRERKPVYVCVYTSVKHSCCRVGSWWDPCDWLSLPLPHPIMLICSGTNGRTPLGVLQAHSQSLVLQKIVLQSYLNRELSSFLISSLFCHFISFHHTLALLLERLTVYLQHSAFTCIFYYVSFFNLIIQWHNHKALK